MAMDTVVGYKPMERALGHWEAGVGRWDLMDCTRAGIGLSWWWSGFMEQPPSP